MNKVVLIGRLTADPNLKFTPGSGAVVHLIIVLETVINIQHQQMIHLVKEALTMI